MRYAGLAGLFLLMGCDAIMTEAPTAGDDFTAPLDGMSNDLNVAFVVGDENFERAFTVAEGLCPIFNNIACEGCHPGDGRGTPEMGFFRFSRGSDLAVEIGGPQHQDKAIPGLRLELIPNGVDLSFRIPPPVLGMELIEAIPVETILANADPDDDYGNGISGRANWVMPPNFVPAHDVGGGDQLQLGRFSRKAHVTSLISKSRRPISRIWALPTILYPSKTINHKLLEGSRLVTKWAIQRFQLPGYCKQLSMFACLNRRQGGMKPLKYSVRLKEH